MPRYDSSRIILCNGFTTRCLIPPDRPLILLSRLHSAHVNLLAWSCTNTVWFLLIYAFLKTSIYLYSFPSIRIFSFPYRVYIIVFYQISTINTSRYTANSQRYRKRIARELYCTFISDDRSILETFLQWHTRLIRIFPLIVISINVSGLMHESIQKRHVLKRKRNESLSYYKQTDSLSRSKCEHHWHK